MHKKEINLTKELSKLDKLVIKFIDIIKKLLNGSVLILLEVGIILEIFRIVVLLQFMFTKKG